MEGYDWLLVIMKYGFSLVLLGVAIFGIITVIRTEKSLYALFSLPALLSIIILLLGILLLFIDTTQRYDFLNLIKVVSGIFTLIYGIYATLNDFFEENEEGKRNITRVGLVGILLFFFSTILSMGADYVKRGIEKVVAQERREHLENIVDKIVVVDKSTGKLGLDFNKFSESLFNDVKKANQALLVAKSSLANREARILELEKNLETEKQNLVNNRTELKKTGESLSRREGELARTRESLNTLETKNKADLDRLSKTAAALKGRESELTLVNKNLAEVKNNLTRQASELNGARKTLETTKLNLASREANIKSKTEELQGVQSRLNKAEANSVSLRGDLDLARKKNAELEKKLSGSQTRATALEKSLSENAKKLAKAETELSATRLSLTKKMSELKAGQKSARVLLEKLLAQGKVKTPPPGGGSGGGTTPPGSN